MTTQIFFVLTYVIALVMRNLKWAHASSRIARFLFYGARRKATTRAKSAVIKGKWSFFEAKFHLKVQKCKDWEHLE